MNTIGSQITYNQLTIELVTGPPPRFCNYFQSSQSQSEILIKISCQFSEDKFASNPRPIYIDIHAVQEFCDTTNLQKITTEDLSIPNMNIDITTISCHICTNTDQPEGYKHTFGRPHLKFHKSCYQKLCKLIQSVIDINSKIITSHHI